ncbi:MAG TPA: bifunctional diaminohydroxyphosphoribosylaminopyrimidine deaminase/5-amino-6-(5-phosphoribosylamino)uracil reductase RibD [Acidimicrobiales bacterium]|jgi:diaminohydroxyphosphoribosylaminopyrimidine deaminase/5-amino-6-(5-phosphoribosylamino)uracil reductase|nr:bifunctional diaminohydroxyphosphoribosylaminopyrimidine deaminase/5-amino-6-(5-phosphoribosylamino)uracil reductase RibD [Acidimicrobiales bacterium]
MSVDESKVDPADVPVEGTSTPTHELSERAKALAERARKVRERGEALRVEARARARAEGRGDRSGGADDGAAGADDDAEGADDGSAGADVDDGADRADDGADDGADTWSYRLDSSDLTEGMRDRFRELFNRGKRLDSRAQGSSGAAPGSGLTVDERWMGVAIDAGERVRARTSPNPWVGAVVVTGDGAAYSGATAPAGGPHAEIDALAAAGDRARGATLYVTLEPCAHQGRTPPCTNAIIAAGIRRVVVGMEDPDRLVAGAGIAALVDAGLEVEVGVGAEVVTDQLAPYVSHRLTGRPWVVLKLAATLDGRTAAPDGTSQWLTSKAARADAHRLRSRSDAVLVGAGTVRADDPALTVRLPETDRDGVTDDQQPLRVVLGHAPGDAKVLPAVELQGDLGEVLDELGRRGIIQLLVEGGPTVAHAFHAAGLVDRYVLYLTPALFGGDDALPLFSGPGAPTLSALWRGSVRSVTSLGGDLRVELSPRQGPEQGE